jgi:hypothetical protein
MYKQIKVRSKLVPNFILRVDDNTFIPFDPDNTDYQAYLKWLEEGNTLLPADDTTA